MKEKFSVSLNTPPGNSAAGNITINWPKNLAKAGSDTAFLLNSPPQDQDASEAETSYKESDTWGGSNAL